MGTEKKRGCGNEAYEKPTLRAIDLAAEEVLAIGCKTPGPPGGKNNAAGCQTPSCKTTTGTT